MKPTTKAPIGKVIAGAGGASIAGPLLDVLLWLFNAAPPADIRAAMLALLSAGLALAAGWLTPLFAGEVAP